MAPTTQRSEPRYVVVVTHRSPGPFDRSCADRWAVADRDNANRIIGYPYLTRSRAQAFADDENAAAALDN